MVGPLYSGVQANKWLICGARAIRVPESHDHEVYSRWCPISKTISKSILAIQSDRVRALKMLESGLTSMLEYIRIGQLASISLTADYRTPIRMILLEVIR